MKNQFFGRFTNAGAAFDSAISGLRQVVEAIDQTPYDPDNLQQTESMIQNLKIGIETGVTNDIHLMYDPEIRQELYKWMVERYTTRVADNQKVEALIARLNEQKTIAENIGRAFDAMEKKMDKIRSNHKGRWRPTETEKAEYEALRDNFLEVYFPVHLKNVLNNSTFVSYFNKLVDPDPEQREKSGLHMSRFFSKHPEGREEFMLVYNDFIGAQNAGLEESDPAQFKQKRDALVSAYHKVMAIRIREKEKLFNAASAKQKADFLDVMTDVVDEKMSTMIKRMGYIDSIIFNWKYNKQKQQDDALKENNDDDD
jgi:hypothetical protein